MLEQLQLAVKPDDPMAHRPGVQCRRDPQQRIEDTDDGQQNEQQLPDQHGEPEWQVALQ